MNSIRAQFVVDRQNRKKSVIIPYATWKRMLEAIEDLEDIRAYQRAKSQPEEYMPFEESVRKIKSKSRRIALSSRVLKKSRRADRFQPATAVAGKKPNEF